jgi:predicted transcriptional regulator
MSAIFRMRTISISIIYIKKIKKIKKNYIEMREGMGQPG